MGKRIIIACVAALAILTLTGCMRQSAYYYVQTDGKVSGTIYVALDEAYVDDTDPYRGTGADDIAAFFDNTSISPFDSGTWKGYQIQFANEPLASFANPPTEAWGIQIVKAGNTYVVHGYTPTSEDESMRQTIKDNDGFIQLTVVFPGSLVEQTGAKESSASGEKPGWAAWDMLTVTDTPYAKGNAGLVFYPLPDFTIIVPVGDPVPVPMPGASVVAPPATEPDPVVTVVVTPSPVSTAAAAVTPSPSPSESPSVVAASDEDAGTSIPAWIWIVGVALLVALGALSGVLAVTMRGRRTIAPAPDAAAAPEAEPESQADAAQAPAKPVTKKPSPKKPTGEGSPNE